MTLINSKCALASGLILYTYPRTRDFNLQTRQFRAARVKYGTNQHIPTRGKRSRPRQVAKATICRRCHSMPDWPLSLSRRWIVSGAGSAGKWQYSPGELNTAAPRILMMILAMHTMTTTTLNQGFILRCGHVVNHDPPDSSRPLCQLFGNQTRTHPGVISCHK